uniref:ARAD1A08558p n=1 Tax=Blastobotrys adeninivorans TaxID=409370 RepID=A0A060SWV8_BLAAD
MHHADHTKFEQASKKDAYEQALMAAEGLFDGVSNWVANTANMSSLLWHLYKSLDQDPLQHVNWVGVYVKDPKVDNQLILGPFQGKVACQTIRVGKGVCGVAAEKKETQLVKDVHKFPGHIACDGNTNSEIVVPIIANDQVVGVIDIDCEELNGFDEVDQNNLEKMAALLTKYCEW